jgi:hypothetical protein
MRNCDWTEKVSLLIDGELGSEEANAVETHLGDCFACRMAREDFLLLRHRISSYHADVNLLAQREALQNILAAGRGDSAASPARISSTAGRRARFAELFALPRLSPGRVAASALVLVCLVVGLLMLRGERQPVEVVKNPQTTAPQNSNAPAATAGQSRQAAGRGNDNSGAVGAAPAPAREEVVKIRPKVPGANDMAKGFPPKGAGGTNKEKFRPKGVGGADAAATRVDVARLPREVVDVPFVIPPRVDVEAREFSEAEVAANDVDAPRDPAPTGLSAARHAEQAQNLLRSFRNASTTGADNLSYERGRSQELLYQNIVLRREAARGGNSNVESTLSQLETILLDIANLPDKPASEDVRSIKNRMERKNIVAMLQVAARD